MYWKYIQIDLMNFFSFKTFSLSFIFFINSLKFSFSFISSISHHNIFIHNQIYFHLWSLGRDLMKKIKDRNFKHHFILFSNLSKFMKFQLNQLYHFISNYTNIPSSIFDDLNGNAVMTVLFEWWILNNYFSIVFQYVTNDLKKSFWDKTNNFLFYSFFSFHLK